MGAAIDYLAIDLGASSGRGVVGSFDGSGIELHEIHRFVNGPVTLATGLHWDAPRLFEEVKRSMAMAAAGGHALSGIGIDTWGVDYGLLSAHGKLIGLPHHYRDPRTHGLVEKVTALVPRDVIYGRTGIQFMPINTLYQLVADQAAGRLTGAASLLFMPDLLHFWLTGIRRSERSIASTSQMLDTATGSWASEILKPLGLPLELLPQVATPGSELGSLLPGIARDAGIVGATVIAPACHDTGSAVAAVPATGSGWAYISSGTWSLVGRELTMPLRTPAAMAANFTNECGVENTVRFHKNVAGLWLLQECQRVWALQGRTEGVGSLCQRAVSEPGLVSLFDPDDHSLSGYGDMPALIRALCRSKGQPEPASDLAVVRSILDSLALKYCAVIESLEALTGPVRMIHIVGGGVQNTALCQFTADACNRPVITGPIEATAMGNALIQALAQGRIRSLADIRAIVATSTRRGRHEPGADASRWKDAYGRFNALVRT